MKLNELYKQYDPEQRHPIVFEKMFQSGAVYMALRPFYIPNDFHLYNEWMNQQIAVSNDRMASDSVFSQGYFRALLKSSNAQSLCGLINLEPAFQVDLFTPLYYPEDSIDGIDLEPEDVIMQVVMSPRLVTHHQTAGNILSFCMDYLSSFTALRRMFWAIGSDYQFYNAVIKKSKIPCRPLTGNGNDVCGYTLR